MSQEEPAARSELSPTGDNLPVAEEIAPGVTREWLADRRVLAYTFKTVARCAVDAWSGDLMGKVRTLPEDRPLLVMQDFSAPGLALTPYIRSRVAEHARSNQGRRGRIALILPRSPISNIAQLFMRRNSSAAIMQRAFFDRDSALAWLREAIEK